MMKCYLEADQTFNVHANLLQLPCSTRSTAQQGPATRANWSIVRTQAAS